jgi:arylformamidase
MPFVLSGLVHTRLQGLFGEGAPYSAELIYDFNDGPPVKYSSHTLKPHSIPHIDAPSHILKDGKTVDELFKKPEFFYGRVSVLRLGGNNWKQLKDNQFFWEITREDLEISTPPERLFIYPSSAPLTEEGYQHPNYISVLSKEAAKWLVSEGNFKAFGTSWKSVDYQPESRERPIHNILLKHAILFEQLKLHHVPQGEYFLCGFPLYLEGASESPLTPVLFSKEELWI